MRTIRFIWASLLILIVAAEGLADLRIRTRTTLGSNYYDEVYYFKGAREREERISENGRAGITLIYQCDLKQQIHLLSQFKQYTLETFQQMRDENVIYRAEYQRRYLQPRQGRGGLITYTYTVTDTGERRELYGFPARHIKSTITVAPSPEACFQEGYRFEIDGWYIDLLYGLRCSPNISGAELYEGAFEGQEFIEMPGRPGWTPKKRKNCRDSDDWSEYKRVGEARMGFPASVTIKHYDRAVGGTPYVTRHEIVEVSRDNLDDALFKVPEGYTQAPVHHEYSYR